MGEKSAGADCGSQRSRQVVEGQIYGNAHGCSIPLPKRLENSGIRLPLAMVDLLSLCRALNVC